MHCVLRSPLHILLIVCSLTRKVIKTQQLKIMFSKSISSVLLTASVLSSLMVTGIVNEATAWPIRARKPAQVQVHPGRIGGSPQLKAPTSIVGQWTGSMNYQGDDVLTNLELNIPAGGGAASWRHMGSKQVNGQWDGVLKQGSLSRSVQGDQVELTLNNFYGNAVALEGSFQNGGQKIAGQKIAGHAVGQQSLLFRFNK